MVSQWPISEKTTKSQKWSPSGRLRKTAKSKNSGGWQIGLRNALEISNGQGGLQKGEQNLSPIGLPVVGSKKRLSLKIRDSGRLGQKMNGRFLMGRGVSRKVPSGFQEAVAIVDFKGVQALGVNLEEILNIFSKFF